MEKSLRSSQIFESVRWSNNKPNCTANIFFSTMSTTQYFTKLFGADSIKIILLEPQIYTPYESEKSIMKCFSEKCFVREVEMRISYSDTNRNIDEKEYNNLYTSFGNKITILARSIFFDHLLSDDFKQKLNALGNNPLGKILFTEDTIRGNYEFSESEDYFFRRSIISDSKKSVLISEAWAKC